MSLEDGERDPRGSAPGAATEAGPQVAAESQPGAGGQPGPTPAAGTEPGPKLRRVTDAGTMRALSHPVRIALVEALAMGGAMTATELGERIGETPTTCSFHLRQLAKYGWVEEAGGGKGRARPWRMTSVGFEMPSTHADAATTIAAATLGGMFRERQLDRYRAWMETRSGYPQEWRDATTDSEFYCYLTAAELDQLGKELNGVLKRWFSEERITDPARRPPGSLPVEVLAFSYPMELPRDSAGPAAGDSGSGETTPGDAT